MKRVAVLTQPLLALVAAFVLTTLVLLSTGVSPLEAYRLVIFGAFSTPVRLSDMIMLAAPLLLCAVGLSITFAGGLYNLGVEGQMIVGAIAAMVPLRLWPDWPPLLLWLIAALSGAAGGALWALMIGILRRYAGVSEIFAGLGMNFLAGGLALYMVLGPWRRQSSASLSGTDLLPRELWLPTIDRLRLAPAAPVIALLALVIVWWTLTQTRWGLEVRAVGLNPAASERLGIATARRMAETFAACGALAGIAGMLQVVAVHHALIPNISSGIGLLGLLVALLARANPRWLLPITVAFAAFTVGSIQLPLTLGIDSAIAGVLQGALVLFALATRIRQ
ncbi:ABC transporter permease [Chloroflexus sp. Y-396-1]|uniref:ABC transporter permease n=1 Tax=Chloroflexus sp. Y-396-1 TaxID=867845 RepID=UPI000491ABA8|nr:ABC transporter permease [Chloroflexus sp. Y-396-1]